MSPEKKRHHCNVTSICLPFENEQNHFRTNQPTVQIITQRGNSNHPKFWIIRPRSHLKSLHKVIINHPANHTVPNSFSEARLIESVRLCLEGTKMRRTSSFYYVYPRREEMRVEHLKRIGLPSVLPTIQIISILLRKTFFQTQAIFGTPDSESSHYYDVMRSHKKRKV